MERTMNPRDRATRSRLEYEDYEDIGRENRGAQGLANALAWFSLGLGALETAAPGAVARFLGIPRRDRVIRAMGMREITAGIGILTKGQPVRWMWARVVGDVIDLAMLGAAVPASERRDRVAWSAGLVAGILAVDFVCARRLAS
ncbi:MAG TPA: hypothetical protein VL503_05970 [Candidatus Omnitrophota bacterium]|jgi:hypothetical protein|nr:hypothetical protein [Candidatus Omnitrophota bacterium]